MHFQHYSLKKEDHNHGTNESRIFISAIGPSAYVIIFKSNRLVAIPLINRFHCFYLWVDLPSLNSRPIHISISRFANSVPITLSPIHITFPSLLRIERSVANQFRLHQLNARHGFSEWLYFPRSSVSYDLASKCNMRMIISTIHFKAAECELVFHFVLQV